jgi:hypothetical protein
MKNGKQKDGKQIKIFLYFYGKQRNGKQKWKTKTNNTTFSQVK